MTTLRNSNAGDIVARISGTDQNGKRFWQTALVTSATRERIRVDQLPECCGPADVVKVVFEKKEAEYRVGKRLRNDEVELTAVEKTICIFPDELLKADSQLAEDDEVVPTTPIEQKRVAPLPVSLGATQPEKRKFPRVVMRVPVEVRSGSTGSSAFGTTSDISAGGCYIEIMSPMSVGAEVEVLSASGLNAKGRVVTAHPTVGMGIAFCDDHPEIVELLFRSASELEKPQPRAIAKNDSRSSPDLRGSQTEQLFSRLVLWFAEHTSLNRDEFCELVRRIAGSEKKQHAGSR